MGNDKRDHCHINQIDFMSHPVTCWNPSALREIRRKVQYEIHREQSLLYQEVLSILLEALLQKMDWFLVIRWISELSVEELWS